MKKLLLTLTIALSFPLYWGMTSEVQAETPPNILIIMADDLGYSDIGCFGSEIKTPRLDELANNGLKFTNFHNTARCWPTRAALMSGYYPQQLGIDPRGKASPWQRTLAHLVKQKNYRAYHSGKWHLNAFSKTIKDGGFDHSYRTESQSQNFRNTGNTLDDVKTGTDEVSDSNYSSIDMTNKMIDFLQDHQKHHPVQPFMAYLAYIVPHFPLQALQEDINIYRTRYEAGWDVLKQERIKRLQELGFPEVSPAPGEEKIVAPSGNEKQWAMLGPDEVVTYKPWNQLTPSQQKFQSEKMAIHAAMIHRMDLEIGRVVDQLKTMQQYENTIIMFLSDNGASAEIMVRGDGHDPKALPGSAMSFLCLGPGWSTACNAPFRRHKIWTHEGGTSTPFIAHWPKGIKAKGELRHTPCHVIDVIPTLLDLVGLPKNPVSAEAPPLPGVSFVPALKEDLIIKRDYIYFSHSGNKGLLQGNWKIVSSKDDADKWELYDVAYDRGETSDLSTANPAILQKMIAKWEEVDRQHQLDRKVDLTEEKPPMNKKNNK